MDSDYCSGKSRNLGRRRDPKISRIDLTQFYPLNGTSVRLCLSMDILAECSFMHDLTDNI